jgi:hypothetical protein
LLGKINKTDLSPDERISRIEMMKKRKYLSGQQQLLIRALDTVLHEPILPFLQAFNRRLPHALHGFGKLLIEETTRTGKEVLVPIDIWLKENPKIYT